MRQIGNPLHQIIPHAGASKIQPCNIPRQRAQGLLQPVHIRTGLQIYAAHLQVRLILGQRRNRQPQTGKLRNVHRVRGSGIQGKNARADFT